VCSNNTDATTSTLSYRIPPDGINPWNREGIGMKNGMATAFGPTTIPPIESADGGKSMATLIGAGDSVAT